MCSNGLKLDKFKFSKDIGKNWLTSSVADEWNRLRSPVVNPDNIESFKRRLDRFRDGKRQMVMGTVRCVPTGAA